MCFDEFECLANLEEYILPSSHRLVLKLSLLLDCQGFPVYFDLLGKKAILNCMISY